MTYEQFAESTQFRKIVQIVSALSTVDTRIVEELRAKFCGSNGGAKKREHIIKIGGEMPIGFAIDPEYFADAIETVVWDIVGRGNWRPFDEARAFVRSLDPPLKGQQDWYKYCQSGSKPPDIPSNPDKALIKDGGLPNDIPSAPDQYYKGKWISWLDWLGGGKRLTGWRPFDEARQFVTSLGIKNNPEWRQYVNSGRKPDDIPSNPNTVYKAEWISWADWFGNGGRQHGHWRPFEEARAFIRSLGFKSWKEWDAYRNSNARPHDIPKDPDRKYKNQGWIGTNDWIGVE